MADFQFCVKERTSQTPMQVEDGDGVRVGYRGECRSFSVLCNSRFRESRVLIREGRVLI